MLRHLPATGACFCFALLGCVGTSARAADFRVTPAAVTLEGNFARAQLHVAAGDTPGDRAADLTRQAQYAVSDPHVLSVSPAGQLLAAGNGATEVRVTVAGITHAVPVTVKGVLPRPHVSFREQVLPI